METIEQRCRELGLCIVDAQQLGSESGYVGLAAACWAIGLSAATAQPIALQDWLSIAARSSNASFRRVLSANELLDTICTAEVSPDLTAHMLYFLDEVPVQTVILALEQASRNSSVPISRMWEHIRRIATQLNCLRGWAHIGYGAPASYQNQAKKHL